MPKTKRPKAIQVHIPDALRARLAALSKRSGAPASELTRRALDAYLSNAERTWDALATHPELLDNATPLEVLALAHDAGAPLPRGRS